MSKKINTLIITGIMAAAMTMGVCAEETFDFEQLSDQTFYFSSGAGAWGTEMDISADGSFTGNYHDSEMGDTGEGYPNGTVYGCTFNGQLSLGEKISDTAYQVTVVSCEQDEGQVEEAIEDEIRYVTTDPAGIKEGMEMVLYLPGQNIGEIPESLRYWLHQEESPEASEKLTVYALCSEQEDVAFVGFEKMSGIANPWEKTDKAGFEKATGLSLAVPEGAENVFYLVMPSEGLGEMQFSLNDLEYTARIKAAAEFEDISGLFYDWTSEEDCKVSYCEGKVLEAPDGAKTVCACMWFDAVPGVMYSLSTSAEDAKAAQIHTVAEAVFEPMQGDA